MPTVTFAAFQTEAHFDVVNLYDGSNSDSTSLVPGGLSGSGSTGQVSLSHFP